MNATATIAPAGPQTIVRAGPQTIVPAGPEPISPGGPEPVAGTGPQPVAPAGPQHMRALERANKVRLARAELKRRVASGELGVAEVILECPWEAQSLLMSQRRWGHTRCRKFLAQIPMSEQKTVGSMTERQRRTLAAMLTATGPVTMPSPPWLTARPIQAGAATGSRMTA
jgi:hypothetical protein